MNHNPLHRPTAQKPDDAPVVLPHVIVTVTDAGALDTTVDGQPFPPPTADGTWTRGRFGELLDAVTQDRTMPVRIDVHEVDGSVFTDIIHARRHTPPEPPETTPHPRRGRRASKQQPDQVEVSAEGFAPGENVAVAAIVSHTDATDTGTARTLLDRAHLASPLSDAAGEVVLYGRASGTTVVRRVP